MSVFYWHVVSSTLCIAIPYADLRGHLILLCALDFVRECGNFYLYHRTIFDQRRVDIIDQVEYGFHDRLHYDIKKHVT